MIRNSLEWTLVEQNLNSKIRNLKYKNEVRKMISGISKEVSELSKLEVLARTGSKYKAEGLLTKINQDIEVVEEYILVAFLIG